MKLQTLFLKLTVIIIGIPLLALGIIGMIWLANNPVNPDYVRILYPIIIGLYLTAIPFFFALYQAFKILLYIDKNVAFSESTVKALKNIKYSGITISTLYVAMLPFVYFLAELDDAPGLILIGLVVFMFAPGVIAVIASLLQNLVEDVIDRL